MKPARGRRAPVADAFLAALALENGATLVTTDRDSTGVPKLRILNPVA